MRLYLWDADAEEWKYIELQLSSAIGGELNEGHIVVQKDSDGINHYLRSGAETFYNTLELELAAPELFDRCSEANGDPAAQLRTELKALMASAHRKLRVFVNDPENDGLNGAYDGLLGEIDKALLGNFGAIDSLPMTYRIVLWCERDGAITDWEDPEAVTWRPR